MAHTLVVMPTPSIVSETVTSVVRRSSSGTATPGTMNGASNIPPDRVRPSTDDLTEGNRLFTRVLIHLWRPPGTPEIMTDTRSVLSGSTVTGPGNWVIAPETARSVNVTGVTP